MKKGHLVFARSTQTEIRDQASGLPVLTQFTTQHNTTRRENETGAQSRLTEPKMGGSCVAHETLVTVKCC
jgi:hypothetical protein